MIMFNFGGKNLNRDVKNCVTLAQIYSLFNIVYKNEEPFFTFSSP